MKAFLDTNVLIRHLTGDPPAQAKRATAFFRAREGALLALPSITVVDHDLLLRAVELYEELRLDFAEAYLVALAESTGVKKVASFDRQIDRVTTVTRVEP